MFETFRPEAKAAVAAARKEAGSNGHPEVVMGHLLVAVLSQPDPLIEEVVSGSIRVDQIRSHVLDLLGPVVSADKTDSKAEGRAAGAGESVEQQTGLPKYSTSLKRLIRDLDESSKEAGREISPVDLLVGLLEASNPVVDGAVRSVGADEVILAHGLRARGMGRSTGDAGESVRTPVPVTGANPAAEPVAAEIATTPAPPVAEPVGLLASRKAPPTVVEEPAPIRDSPIPEPLSKPAAEPSPSDAPEKPVPARSHAPSERPLPPERPTGPRGTGLGREIPPASESLAEAASTLAGALGIALVAAVVVYKGTLRRTRRRRSRRSQPRTLVIR